MFDWFHFDRIWIFAILLLINAGLALIPARIAKNKGYSFVGFWCISFFVSFLIGIIFAAALPVKRTENDMENLPDTKRAFSRSYLGLIMTAVLLVMVLVLGSFSPFFFDYKSIPVILMQLVPYGLIAFAVMLATRAKGPDLSLGAVVTASGLIAASIFASGGSLAASITAALAASIFAGVLTGALTVYARLPSILSSSGVLVILSVANRLISLGRPVIVPKLNGSMHTLLLPGGVIILIFAIISAFLIVSFTRLGKPMSARTGNENHSVESFIVYVVGALLAGIAGVYMLLRIGSAMPETSGIDQRYILFIFGVLLSSRFLDNRFTPAFYAFIAAILYVMLSIAMSILSVSSFWQFLLTALYTIAFVTVGTFASRNAIKNMLTFGRPQ